MLSRCFLLAAIAGLALSAGSVPARADWHGDGGWRGDGGRWGWRGHDWHGGWGRWGEPDDFHPWVYAPPPAVYYAPPPVYYAPPPPAVSFGFGYP